MNPNVVASEPFQQHGDAHKLTTPPPTQSVYGHIPSPLSVSYISYPSTHPTYYPSSDRRPRAGEPDLPVVPPLPLHTEQAPDRVPAHDRPRDVRDGHCRRRAVVDLLRVRGPWENMQYSNYSLKTRKARGAAARRRGEPSAPVRPRRRHCQ